MSQPVEVTEAEERFLRAFVRREMLPWFGACVVMALVLAAMSFAVATSLATPVLSESSREMGAARALAASGDAAEGANGAAPEDWDAQLDQLRSDLEERLNKGEGGVTKLSAEVAAAVKSMKTLRDRVARAERTAKAGGQKAAGPALASADLSRILKRLQGIETRQSEMEQKREKFTQDTLKRLLGVEVGRDRSDEDRLANDEKARQRLQNLEARLSQMEGGAGGSRLPASQP